MSNQVSVEVISGQQVGVERASSSVPTVTEVSVPGPQGPALVGSLLIDVQTIGIIYAGRSQEGSNPEDPVRTITRSTYSPAGIRTSKGQAVAVTWTGRTSHTYAP